MMLTNFYFMFTFYFSATIANVLLNISHDRHIGVILNNNTTIQHKNLKENLKNTEFFHSPIVQENSMADGLYQLSKHFLNELSCSNMGI